MTESWKWKSWGSLVLVLYSIYLLIPSMIDVKKLTQAQPNSFIAKLLPSKAMNLGLDLRGGLYLELDVDLEKARANRVDLIAGQVESFLAENKTAVEKLEPDSKNNSVVLEVPADAKKAVSDLILKQFEGVFSADVSSGQAGKDSSVRLSFKFDDAYLNYVEDSIIKQALESVRNRVDRYGVNEASVQRQGSSRIVVEVPGEKDPERVIDLIRKTGQLEFRLVDTTLDPSTLQALVQQTRTEKNLGEGYSYPLAGQITEALKGKIPENTEILFEVLKDPVTQTVSGGRPYLVEKRAKVTGEMLKNAQVNVVDNRPSVSLTFDQTGTTNFGQLTKDNVNKQLAIVLDGMISSAPNINEPILSGQAEISLGFGAYQSLVKEADDLALILREGALPSSMEVASKNVIGPSMGQDSIRQGLNAIYAASLVVIIFMMLYYKWSGLIANLALFVNVTLIFGIMSLMQASLSLPGLAGIVLTIGMAVDANIIIFERMREEKRLGKTARAIIDSGYSNAMSAIVDGNLTTLISGIVLYQFGTGPIKGFATTLMIGILTTMFTAIVITRLVYDYFIFKKRIVQVSV